MTAQPDGDQVSGEPERPAITHPAIGVLIDPRLLVAARKSAMLERIELAELSGVSRDAIAKLENGDRKRPKVTTLRKLIDALNKARAERGKGPIDVEDIQMPGEVLIPASRSVLPLTSDDDEAFGE